MISWLLDIDTRATTKKREFQRTYQKLCLYIKHLEGEFVPPLLKGNPNNK
jgi:hypothetical protein